MPRSSKRVDPGNDGVKRALGREGADVKLVEDKALAVIDPRPATLIPGEAIGEEDGRGTVGAVGLPTGERIGQGGGVVKRVGVATTRFRTFCDGGEVAPRLGLHRDMPRLLVRVEHQLDVARLRCPDTPAGTAVVEWNHADGREQGIIDH